MLSPIRNEARTPVAEITVTMPAPRLFQESCLLHLTGGPCNLRLHSQRPPARSQASSTTDSGNSNPLAIGRL